MFRHTIQEFLSNIPSSNVITVLPTEMFVSLRTNFIIGHISIPHL